MTETRKFFYVSLLILLGVVLRMSYLAAPHIDADQAVFGLEGMHVLKGEFPVFSWGYAYIGTLQSYMDAAVFYFFGPSREALNSVAFLFYILYGFSLYGLSTVLVRSFSLQLLVVALGAVAPDFFMIHGAWGRHGYPETFAFGSLLLLMVAKGVNRSLSSWFYFGLCFVAGVAWWSNFLVIYYFVPVFVFQLYQIFKRYDSFVKVSFFSFLGFFTGGFPFWWYNFRNDFASFDMFGGGGVKSDFLNALSSFFSSFPVLIGARQYDSGAEVVLLSKALCLLMGFMALFCLVYFGVKCLAGLVRRRLEAVDFVWIFYVSILVIFFTSQYAYVGDSTNLRYLVPFYSLYPLIPALALDVLGQRFRLSLWVMPLSFFLVVMNFISLTQGSPFFSREKIAAYRHEMDSQNGLFEELKKTGKSQFLMHEYWEAMRYTFDSKEELIFADVNCRYPKYIYDMVKNRDLNYLILSNLKSFENSVEVLGSACEKAPMKAYTLYDRFVNRVSGELSTVSEKEFLLSTQAGPDREGLLTDRVLRTAAFFPLTAKKKPFLDVRFKSPRAVMGAGFILSDVFCSPEKIHILDLKSMKPVKIIKDFLPGYRMGALPFIPFSPRWFEVYFEPVETDHLRFLFLPKKGSKIVNFGVAEVFFFERGAGQGAEEDGAELRGEGQGAEEDGAELRGEGQGAEEDGAELRGEGSKKKGGVGGEKGKGAEGRSSDEELLDWLKARKDRFEAIAASPGAAFFAGEFPEKTLYSSVDKPVKISFSRKVLFVFEKLFLEYNRGMLEKQGFRYEVFEGAEYAALLANVSEWKEMEWLGKFLLKSCSIDKGEKYFQKALKYMNSDSNLAYENLLKSLYFHPNHYYAFLLLLDTAKHLGKSEEYEQYLSYYQRIFEAQYPMKSLFRNIIEFKGITIISPSASVETVKGIPVGIHVLSGSSVSLAYDYVFHEKIKNDFMVFVHFKDADGKVLFQNDHTIEHPLIRKNFAPGEMRRCFQQVEIPDYLSFKSPVSVWLGIWDPEEKKRFKAETSLEYQDRSVKIAEIIPD